MTRLKILFYLFNYIALIIEKIFFFLPQKSCLKKTHLLIEAGNIGWTHIDYNEQFSSAKEYLEPDGSVSKVIIQKNKSYILQAYQNVRDLSPSHYFYDCRSGAFDPYKGLIEAFCLRVIFKFYNVIPICHLTDFPHLPWRLQVSLVANKKGIITTLMSPKLIKQYSFGGKYVGPVPMAFSKASYEKVTNLEIKNNYSLVSIGSLYEPRKSFLEKVQNFLNDDVNFELFGRDIGSKRFKDEDYWKIMASSKNVISTSFQMNSNYTDRSASMNHAIYRYFEVLITGSQLISTDAPSLNRILEPDVHYKLIKNPEEINNLIPVNNIIKKNADRRMQSIIDLNLFWLLIDYGLSEDSLK